MAIPPPVRSVLPIAELWVASASRLLASRDPRDAALRDAALRVNFAFAALEPPARAEHAAWIRASFERIAKLLRSANLFRATPAAEARRIFGAAIPPAYSYGGGKVHVTDAFARFGPKCRAAMLVHETVHVFDERSGTPEVHVSEWDPHFDEMTPDEQLHNPSAYASFAAQVHHGALAWPRSERFGAGRPND
jgi:hypothetical protein